MGRYWFVAIDRDQDAEAVLADEGVEQVEIVDGVGLGDVHGIEYICEKRSLGPFVRVIGVGCWAGR